MMWLIIAAIGAFPSGYYTGTECLGTGGGEVTGDVCLAGDNLELQFGAACGDDGNFSWNGSILTLAIGAATVVQYTTSQALFYNSIRTSSVNGPKIANENVSGTNPTINPYGSDPDSGMGAVVPDHPTITAGGVNMLSCPESTDDACIAQVGWVYNPSGDQSLANDGAVACGSNAIARVVGNGGAVTLSAAPSVSDGSADGQYCIIQGTHDTNTVTINDNTNVQLAGGAAVALGKGDTLTLIWDSGDSDWYETSRSDN